MTVIARLINRRRFLSLPIHWHRKQSACGGHLRNGFLLFPSVSHFFFAALRLFMASKSSKVGSTEGILSATMYCCCESSATTADWLRQQVTRVLEWTQRRLYRWIKRRSPVDLSLSWALSRCSARVCCSLGTTLAAFAEIVAPIRPAPRASVMSRCGWIHLISGFGAIHYFTKIGKKRDWLRLNKSTVSVIVFSRVGTHTVRMCLQCPTACHLSAESFFFCAAICEYY